MRLTYILVVTVAATLHASTTAFSSVRESKTAIENGTVPVVVDSTLAEGGRLLRWVDDEENYPDDDDEDDFDEERGFGDAIKKLNPVTAVKKSAQKTKEHAAKVKEALREVADYQDMIKRAREIIKD
ncbi:hypothetical protein P3T76_007310 [Phytophthora citrophthora]|uniref:RxLR effector protein n=1 Tax=Phytophthora citrophthora TaxID=4793 RepID=A0AAD9GMA1_9STRA|nr:hypothetical protein P3T76_007310 [Phytophthora citrophthora]